MTLPKLIVMPLIEPDAWRIRTEADESATSVVVCEIPERLTKPGFAKGFADLFAAAPDLYAALTAVFEHEWGTSNELDDAELEEQCRSALAKARGEGQWRRP